jgi:hypothetical protein
VEWELVVEEVMEEAGGESMKPPEGVPAMVGVDEGGKIDDGRDGVQAGFRMPL